MAIRNIIAMGVGFSPGGVLYIPTLGFSLVPVPATPHVVASTGSYVPTAASTGGYAASLAGGGSYAATQASAGGYAASQAGNGSYVPTVASEGRV